MPQVDKSEYAANKQSDPADLDKLRELLLGDQLERTARIEARLDQPDQRCQEIAKVLPKAIEQSSLEDPDGLQSALSSSVEKTIFQRVREEPDAFAEALYPAILPAIRKAIHDAISSTMEHIDETLKTRFSMNSLRWRFESMRTGTPLPAIILRESSPFVMDQVLLIQNGSGLLMDHRYSANSKDVDRDAVSGMLWAIESFVRDAFSSETDGLNRVTTGSHILYLLHGRLATLVCVCQGVAPLSVIDDARDTLAKIESFQHETLSKFDGDHFGIAGAQDALDRLISAPSAKPTHTKAGQPNNRSRWLLAAGLATSLLITSIFTWRFMQYKEITAITADLNAIAGVKIFTVSRHQGGWKLDGIADPAAGHIPDSIKSNIIPRDKIVLDLLPVNSANPELTGRKLAAAMSIPQSAQWTFDKNRLAITGEVPPDWYYSVATNVFFLAGTVSIDTRGVTVSEKTLGTYLRTLLSGLDDVNISTQSGVVYVSGEFSPTDYLQLKKHIRIFQSKVIIDDSKCLIKNNLNGAG